jgi:hypothetical protein
VPRDVTPHLFITILLGFAIWGSWFYALYRGVTLPQPPGRSFWAWLILFGSTLLAGTVFVIRQAYL